MRLCLWLFWHSIGSPWNWSKLVWSYWRLISAVQTHGHYERIHFNAGLIWFGFIILQTPFALGVLNNCKMWLISAAICCQAPEWSSNLWSHFMLLCFEEKFSKEKRVRPTWSFTKLIWLTCTDGQMLSGVISVLQPALWVDNLSACHHRCSRDYGSHVNMYQHFKFNNTQFKYILNILYLM